MMMKLLGVILGTCLYGICRFMDSKETRCVSIEKPIEYVDRNHIKCSHGQWDSLSDEEKAKIMYVEFRL